MKKNRIYSSNEKQVVTVPECAFPYRPYDVFRPHEKTLEFHQLFESNVRQCQKYEKA